VHSGYFNLRGYHDIETENRPKSTTIMATFVISPAAPAPHGPMFVKAK
jgi:hypothetical protein